MPVETFLPLHLASTDESSVKDTETESPLYYPGKENEVLEMVLGDDFDEEVEDVLFGRMPVGGDGDESDFDYLPRNEIEITPEMLMDIFAGDEEPAVPFSPPAEEQFPVFTSALKHFESSKPKAVRIDTEKSYDDFVCEKAVKELQRRVDALEAALQAHEENPLAHVKAFRKHVADYHTKAEVLGAAQAVAELKSANNAEEAAEAFKKVPVNVSPFAHGKVKCWKDGDHVVCSMKFQCADGGVRVATMASKPKADKYSVLGWASRAGLDAVTILGVLPDLVDSTCGSRLVKEVAGAALDAHRRLDVCDMDSEAIHIYGDDTNSPLAAIMYLQQKADAGDRQARNELAMIRLAAQTPSGRKVAGPLLEEADRRLKSKRRILMARYL